MDKEILKWQMEKCLEALEKIDSDISKSMVQNEQFVLDFYDKLNEISVRR